MFPKVSLLFVNHSKRSTSNCSQAYACSGGGPSSFLKYDTVEISIDIQGNKFTISLKLIPAQISYCYFYFASFIYN